MAWHESTSGCDRVRMLSGAWMAARRAPVATAKAVHRDVAHHRPWGARIRESQADAGRTRARGQDVT